MIWHFIGSLYVTASTLFWCIPIIGSAGIGLVMIFKEGKPLVGLLWLGAAWALADRLYENAAPVLGHLL